jgi:hypothetical protein
MEVLVGTRPTLCKVGSNLRAKGRAAETFIDGDS